MADTETEIPTGSEWVQNPFTTETEIYQLTFVVTFSLNLWVGQSKYIIKSAERWEVISLMLCACNTGIPLASCERCCQSCCGRLMDWHSSLWCEILLQWRYLFLRKFHLARWLFTSFTEQTRSLDKNCCNGPRLCLFVKCWKPTLRGRNKYTHWQIQTGTLGWHADFFSVSCSFLENGHNNKYPHSDSPSGKFLDLPLLWLGPWRLTIITIFYIVF